jgi:hypothetical protein
MRGILPDAALPSATPASSDADFVRSLHPQRRHWEAHNTGGGADERAERQLFTGRARARFEPEYPRVSRVARVEPPAATDASATLTGRRVYPGKTNVESLREGLFSTAPEGMPVGVPRVAKVVDPATGKLVRWRTGLETDFLKLHGVPHLQRFPDGARDPETVTDHHRGGLGFSKPGDLLYKEVEWSDNFWGSKPDRWYADPAGRAPRVAMVGLHGGPGGGAAAASAGGGATRSVSQLQANHAAMAAAAAAGGGGGGGGGERGAAIRARPSTGAGSGRVKPGRA